MQQKIVGNLLQTVARILIVDALGFVAAVPGCQHDGTIQSLHQQPMQRRVRQHESQRGLSRRHPGGYRLSPGIQNNDGSLSRAKRRPFNFIHAGISLNHGSIAGHQCKGFMVSLLALPQSLYRLLIAGITSQMDAAYSLDRDDFTLRYHSLSGGYGILIPTRLDHLSGGTLQPNPGTAYRAGVGLRMKTPVGRVLVLGKALRTHGKGRHAGIGPVVGNGADYREPGTAMRTVGKGITKTAVCRVIHLLPTGIAYGGIGSHVGLRLAGHTGVYLESIGYPPDNHRTAFDALYPGQRRAFALQRTDKSLQLPRTPPDPDTHAKRIVPDRPRKLMHTGKPPDRRAETDALHRAVDTDGFRDDVFRSCHLYPASAPPAWRYPGYRTGSLLYALLHGKLLP